MSESPAAEALAADLAWLDAYEAKLRADARRREYAVRLGAVLGVPHELARDWTVDDLRWIERQVQMTLDGA